MSHPIHRYQLGPFLYYRMGTTLIAEKGDKRFVILEYTEFSGDGRFEASVQHRHGLKMPIKGDVFPTRRAAAEYLLEDYLAA